MPKVRPLPSTVVTRFLGTMSLSDSPTARRQVAALDDSRLQPHGVSHVAQQTFRTCCCHYPGGPTDHFGCHDPTASAFARSLEARRRDFTFEACSAFTRVAARAIAPPALPEFAQSFDRRVTPPSRPGCYRGEPTTPRADLPSAGFLNFKRDAQRSPRSNIPLAFRSRKGGNIEVPGPFLYSET